MENPDEFQMRELNTEEMTLAASSFRSLVLASAVSLLVTEQYASISELFKVIKESYQDFIIPGFAEHSANHTETFETRLSSLLRETSGPNGRTPIAPDNLIRLQLLILQAQATVIPTQALARLPHWIQQVWRETISQQGFRLKTPGYFARELQNVQIIDDDPIVSTARIVRLAANYVSVQLSPEYHEMLAQLSSQHA
ncbi:hypothetical protein FS827_26440 [Agrobacterium vitis]|nr:hypothetical protein [Allorhizobium ampelinum]